MITYEVKVSDDGTQFWYLNGEFHREDGPAVIYHDGNEYWYLNGKYHREDGPAIIQSDGTEYWCLNGKIHREDGPAAIYHDGTEHWYLNDIEYTEEEFNRKMNPTKELTVEQISNLLGYDVKVVKG